MFMVVYCICSDPAYSGGGSSHGTTCPDRQESEGAGSAALIRTRIRNVEVD